MAKSAADREPTKANGFSYGRPENVERSELDLIIEKTIEELPMELRLYPDVYAWRITAAVNGHLAQRFPQITDSLR